jgi:hypothetical protein
MISISPLDLKTTLDSDDAELVKHFSHARLHAAQLARDAMASCCFPVVCDIRPSSIHGRGVFALQDLPAESFVTFYPADFVVWKPPNWQGPKAVAFASDGTADIDFSGFAYLMRDYGLLTSFGSLGHGELSIAGDVRLTSNPLYLGHMVNDARGAGAPNARYASCKEPENAACYIETLRPVRKGEEILTEYAAAYWLNRLPSSRSNAAGPPAESNA